ncbi:hypothetical protein M758_UG312900 [Ceratodon purpureus]|nr:hypothetical protein M758_UG312900 [Ceratodon purpureus]
MFSPKRQGCTLRSVLFIIMWRTCLHLLRQRFRGYDPRILDPGQGSPATPIVHRLVHVAILSLRRALVTDIDRICNVFLIVHSCRRRNCRGHVSVNENLSSQELRHTGGLYNHIVFSAYCIAVTQAMN